MEHGLDKLESSDKCSYIAGKRYKKKTCRRHGGELPPLQRGGTCLESISDASGGSLAERSFVRKLRHSARSAAHPFGQDSVGVADLSRRAGYQHDYVRATIKKQIYTVVVLQNEKQAEMSGTVRFFEADSTSGVVTPGSAKDGVEADAIRGSGKQAFYWHHFSIISFVPSLNRAVTLLRAMVIGKTASMYEEILEFYFSSAADHGPVGPGGRVAIRAGGGKISITTPFVSGTMDFETAQHLGFTQGLCRVFCGTPADYAGRVVGRAVHFKRFLLGPCGNKRNDPPFKAMVQLRDADAEGGAVAVRLQLSALAVQYKQAGGGKKANIIKWLFKQ
eukprot:contig_6591_g1509